jgi:hypothetical protein
MVRFSEVFEVMVQVDHDLTTARCFDRQLGLIKNLGCHSYQTGGEVLEWLGE